MIASTRRSFVAALLGMGLVGARPLSGPLQAAPGGILTLPDRPLRLVRMLERGLDSSGAAAITVRRWWDVIFERQGRGILVSGRQAGAEVTAPPHLAELARLEQQRDASGMFPLILSEQGLIMTSPAAPGESDTVTKALRAAEAMIARQRQITPEDRASLRFYLAELHRAGSGLLDTLPGDLLFPTSAPVERRETVALPGGLTGEFALRYSAEPQPQAPWLARAERRVVTTVGESQRRAAEVWTLGPE